MSLNQLLKPGDKFYNYEHKHGCISEVEVHVVGKYRSIIKHPNPYVDVPDAGPYYCVVPNHTLVVHEEYSDITPGDYVACVFRNECHNGLVIDGTEKSWNVMLETGEVTKKNGPCKRVKKESVFLLSKCEKNNVKLKEEKKDE